MEGYGQFCPVALASEILTRRWTPLVVRELLCGSRRFNEIRRGVPRMSPSLLSRRLSELERAGVVVRRSGVEHDHDEYHLTEAGEELRPLIEGLGRWGQRWVRGRASTEDEDPDVELLMWDVGRRIDTDETPDERTVVRFEFPEQEEPELRHIWLVLEGDEVDVCYRDPGRPVDLEVRTDARAFTAVWLGDVPLSKAIGRKEIELRGPRRLRRAFPGWLGLSLFADVPRP